MNLSLYTSATGMEAQQLQLNTIANNLANANTIGYKRAKIEFQDMLYQRGREAGAVSGDGNELPTNIEMGNGTQVVSTARVFTQGSLRETGARLDLAIDGPGFFEVELPDGESGYTRDGALKVASDGRITTSNGYPVLSNFQALPDGVESISITPTGDVTVRSAQSVQTFRIQLVRFNNPAGLRSIGGNMYVETTGSGEAQIGNPAENGYGRILQGYVESSNVNIVEEMVNMITAQRAYEINSKAIQSSDEMLQVVGQLKR
ncbi:MAG: flagellar basal-body rod protein FlgG [Verrucomicrobia bacterium]|nr:flagellar basal-body rod protein FlgG [Verrucomicrobiota bacterium]